MREGNSLPAIGALEILVILIAIVLFGPKRIPELARQVGSALAQLRSASDDFMRELTRGPRELQDDDEPSAEKPKDSERPAGKEPDEGQGKVLTDDQIREAALKLGIRVEGKTREELQTEMLERVYSSQTDPYGLEDKAG